MSVIIGIQTKRKTLQAELKIGYGENKELRKNKTRIAIYKERIAKLDSQVMLDISRLLEPLLNSVLNSVL